MRKAWCLFALIFLVTTTASAQSARDVSKADVFLGYSYVRANPGFGSPGINFNGGSANFAYNASRSVGLVADFGGYRTGSFGGGNIYTYMFGPRLSYHADKITPFAQVLFGGARDSDFFLSSTSSKNAFAMAVGGGVDVNASRHVAIRVGQFEYLMTHFDVTGTGGTRQNNVRFSSGVVFRW